MNSSTLLRITVPHIIAILIFIIVTIIFYSPLFFEGKKLNQNDIQQGIASGREIIEHREKTGEEALWTNSMFGGMPAYLINTDWSGSKMLVTIEKIITLGFPASARETFLCLICFYILLIVFGVRPYLAIPGAIAYGFSTFFIVSIEAGHLWKLRAIAYAPLVLAGIHLLYLRKYWIGFALTALAMALELNSNHLQITYYLILILLIYGISQLAFSIKTHEVKRFAVSTIFVVAAVVLALGTNIGKVWATYEYGKYSIRGASELSSNKESSGGLNRDYAFQWSSGVAESLTFIVPNFYGGASGNYSGKNSDLEKALVENNVPSTQVNQYVRGLLGYWGPQPFTSGPVYLGVAICFLFVLGIILVEPRFKWWLIVSVIISIMLSWGNNFPVLNYFLFDTLPLYNKFRAVSMTVFIAILAMPLMGFMGLEKMISEPWSKERQKELFIAGSVTLSIILLITLIAYVPEVNEDQFPDWLKGAIKSSRKSIVRKDALRSLFFLIITFGAIYMLGKGKLSKTLAYLVIILIVSVDLIGLDYRYVNSENYVSARKNNFLSPTPADQVILKDTSPGYRVLNMQSLQEARTSAFHSSLGGYHGAKMRRYQDLMDHQLTSEITTISQEGRLSAENTNVISMLNAKYLLLGTAADAVILNPYANGSAWFIKSLKKVNTPDEEMDALNNIDTKTEAVIDISKFQPDSFKFDSAATIILSEYAPNRLLYKSSSSEDGYAVFSEIYYPKGWKAYIDNNETSIDRVNFVLRGLNVPSGQHSIEFKFEPVVYFTGNKIMWVSTIILILCFITAMVIVLKKMYTQK